MKRLSYKLAGFLFTLKISLGEIQGFGDVFGFIHDSYKELVHIDGFWGGYIFLQIKSVDFKESLKPEGALKINQSLHSLSLCGRRLSSLNV